MTTHRKSLLKRLKNIRWVPGEGPSVKDMSDEELELFVKLAETMSEKGRKAREVEDE